MRLASCSGYCSRWAASSTVRSVGASSSWGRYPIRSQGRFRIAPSSGESIPIIIRSRVVFPVPFRPTRPTRVSGRRWAAASEKSVFVGYCLVKDSIWSIVQSGKTEVGLAPGSQNQRKNERNRGGFRPTATSSWWSWPGLNRRPRECHSRALPTAPQPHSEVFSETTGNKERI